MDAINALEMESRLIMKRKLLPMLIGAIALTLTAAPLPVQAQDDYDYERATYGQGQYQGRGQGRFAGINLSQNQKDQMARIRRDTQDRIQRILTSSQRQQLQSLRQNRQEQRGTTSAQGQRGRRGIFSSLNLSDDQKRQLRDIMKDSKSRMDAVLTSQQREQMQRNIQNMRSRRQQSNGQFNRY